MGLVGWWWVPGGGLIVWWGLSLQDMFSSDGHLLDVFHSYVCGILLFILFVVGYALCVIASSS